MAFEPSYEKIVSSVRKNLGGTQVIVEGKLPLNDGDGVSKILCANANAYISNSEVVGRDVSFNGYVGFQVVYSDEMNNLQGLDYSAEFRDKFMLENGVVAVPIVKANVVEVKYAILDNLIKVTAIVEINVDGILTEETNALVGSSNNETFFKNEYIEYLTYENMLNEKFEIVGDMEIKDSVQKILSVCPSVFIENITTNSNYITVRGGVNINVCYISDEESSILRSYNTQFDFSQDVAGESVNENSVIQSLINVVLNDVKVTTTMEANSATINIIVPVLFKGFNFTQKSSEIVTDLFNLQNMMGVDYQSVDLLEAAPPKSYVEKITGAFIIDENQPFIDEVTGVCANNIVLANTSIVNNNLLVEGVASSTVLYFNKESNTTNSIEVEIPFSINLDSKIPEGFTPSIGVSFGEVLAKGKRGKEIDIEGKIFAYIDFYKTTNDAVISQVEVLEERVLEDYALSIYIVKDGETLWDIAKEMNISPDLILEQNPNVELPLKAGEKIVIYRQKVLEF